MVVVYYRTCRQLYPRPHCGPEREHYPASLGLHRFFTRGNHYCAIRECSNRTFKEFMD